MEQSGNIFIGLLIVGSGFVWWRMGAKARANVPLLPYREGTRLAAGGWNVLLIVSLWVAIPITVRLLFGRSEELGLPDVRSTCLASALSVIVGLVLLIFRLPPEDGPRRKLADFGIESADCSHQAAVGIVWFLGSLLPVFAVLALSSPLRDEESSHGILKLLNADASADTLAWIGLAVVVLAPLSEELVFRVAMQGWLESRIAPHRAVVLVAILFSSVHGMPDALPLFPLALILGYIYYRQRSYIAVVLLHALFNATMLLAALLLRTTKVEAGIAFLVE